MPIRRSRAAIVIIVVGVLGLVGVVLAYTNRVALREWWETRNAEPVPPAVNRNEAINTNATVNTNKTNANTNAVVLPAEVNLNVPFTSQAPHANWDEDHGEFCEEASVLMLGRYWQDRGIVNADDAESALQLLKRWEVLELGYYFDTTATETARILSEFYELKGVEVVRRPTVEDIKRELAAGRPVIVPAAGRELGNPNFTPPGPIYHMLVIKGYTRDGKFITNDPGTRKGADYVYDINVVMDALHDWVPSGDRTQPRNGTPSGPAAMIVVRGE
ncbi:MAG: C39 family peptidase [Candidatus Kerfeldbacteria bacterium]|nr:C39 family peptidase [Candidatus Kerfeldbacteria bacterium]